MSSLFKGLTEDFRSQTPSNNNLSDEGEVFIAQVLEVIKNTTDLEGLKQEPAATGLIRFNKTTLAKRPESAAAAVAEPLDRANYRLPLAGEQVLVVRRIDRYYYFNVMSPLLGMLLNIDPTLLLSPYESSDLSDVEVDPDVEAIRFELRHDFEQETLKKKTSLQTRPREGETILEGRMGGVIKLTHTNTKEGVWDKEKQITNLGISENGDPMLVIKSHVREKNSEFDITQTNALEDDNINVDRSSLYLTTTQVVPLQVLTSRKMYSWNLPLFQGKFALADDPSARFSSMFPELSYDPNFVPSVDVSGLQAQVGPGGVVSGVNDSGVPGSSATAKSIDDLKVKFQSLGYSWPGQLHFVGIRSSTNINTGGGVATKNRFADLVGYVDETVSPPVVKFFPATTVPGKSYLRTFYPGQNRTAILMPAQYKNGFKIGIHIEYKAFRQNAVFGIFNDRNQDDIPDSTPSDTASGGNYGINLHRAGANYLATTVDNYSAGCQVLQQNIHLQEMLRAAEAASSIMGTTSFTYTLIMSF